MKCHPKTLYLLMMLQFVRGIENVGEHLPEDRSMLNDQLSPSKYNLTGSAADLKLDNNRSRDYPRYTVWSKWGDCDENTCVRSRRRKCIIKRKCGDTTQIEEKRCKFVKRRGRKRSKCGRKRWKDKNHSDSIVPNYSNSTSDYNDELEDKRKYRFKIVDMEALEKKILPSKSSKWYSKWTRWSYCSRQCTTHRKRWCKRPKLCFTDVIKETAYCYVEGTFCQQWINKKIRNKKQQMNGELLVDTVIEELPNKERNDVDNSVFNTASQMQCGIAYSGRNSTYKKGAWSMTRIIGGRQAPRGKWPWQVAILNKNREVFCGGTLVNPRWVLTAAHCIRKKLYVRVGGYNLANRDGIEMSITQTIIHPEYDSVTVDNDLALLRLPYKPFKQLGVACLPKQRQVLPTNKLCTIIGWGKRRSTDSRGSDLLHEAQVPIVSMDICENTYIDYHITSNMFCAGYRKGHMDSCSGDSGGPLLCSDLNQPHQPWTIFGITSFGDGCGKRGKYGIYTRVPNFVRWINKVLKMT